MKSPRTIISNTFASAGESGKLEAHLEIGIVLQDIQYKILDSQLIKSPECKTVRFSAPAEVIRTLGQKMIEMADAADKDIAEATK